MDVREKLVKIVCDAMESDGCIGHCNHSPCFEVERVVNALIDNGVTVQEWISVDDKLPEKSGYYLVFADNGRREVLSYSKKYQAFNAFDDAYSEEYVIPVTHWTPMPNPPKGE